MKKIIVIGLVLASLMSMVGCTKEKVVDIPSSNEIESKKDIDKISDKVVFEGKIMKFDGDKIHIISGDIVDILDYNGKNEGFYLGQEVKLLEGEEGNYLIKSEIDDFTMSHTTMGMPIFSIKGNVISSEDGKFVVESKGEQMVFENYNENTVLSEGEAVEIYYLNTDDKIKGSALMVLQENMKMRLEIVEITRDEEGRLIAKLVNQTEELYTIDLSSANVEFDISEVAVGDELIVYYDMVMESYPMQLGTVLIRK